MSDVLDQLKAGKLRGSKKLDLGGLGLKELPAEVFDLSDSLEMLNLSQNALTDLPKELGRLGKLRILFASQNAFTHVPEVVGECAELSMVGFKANRIEHVPAASLPPKLRWLILTDNAIEQIPAELGNRPLLQKLMLSGNRLKELPVEMAACENLELVRLASNDFEDLPIWLLELPRLAWLAIGGNPCAALPEPAAPVRWVDWEDLEVLEKLGEGASGLIYRARWNGIQDEVAVKVFKGAVTSDGLPESEMAAGFAAGKHAHLIESMAQVRGHPEGKEGLVMALLDAKFRSLAGPPSFDSCTRDVYAGEVQFGEAQVRSMALAMASAAAQLHEHGLMHGDFYAHNIVWDGAMECVLGDFGGASFYPQGKRAWLERIEVRAFGCLLEELLERNREADGNLTSLKDRCLASQVLARPSFVEVVTELQAES